MKNNINKFAAFKWFGADLNKFFIITIICAVLWFASPPSGISIDAWHVLTIFVGTILGIILQPLPLGAVALMVIAFSTLSKVLTVQQALNCFGSNIVWLVFAAFLIARGFIKTGLGTRIAYLFISKVGSTTLGLSYGLIATEFFLSPLIPSNAARGAGVMFPMIMALNKEYDSLPTSPSSAKKIGAYLIQLMYHANTVTSSMFLTAMAANPFVVCCAAKMGVHVTWMTWAIAAFVPGLVCLILLPLLMFMLSPPKIRETPDAPGLAKSKLKEMGPLTFAESTMLITFVLLLIMWIGGPALSIDPAVAALTGLGLLLFTGVLSWDDVLHEKNAWNTYLWLSVLLMLAGQLNDFGLVAWLANALAGVVSGMHWIQTLAIVASFYFFSHYLFASVTAHVSSMFGALLMVALASGSPPLPTVILLGAFSSISGSLTHYGTGTAPVFFGAGYVSIAEWWKNGLVISCVHIAVWVGIGFSWWRSLGWW